MDGKESQTSTSCGTENENQSADTGDTGTISGPGGFHKQSN